MSDRNVSQYRLDVVFSSAVVPLRPNDPVLVVSYGWARGDGSKWNACGQEPQSVETNAAVLVNLVDLSVATPEAKSSVTEVVLDFGESGPINGQKKVVYSNPLFVLKPFKSEALNMDCRMGWYSFAPLTVTAPATVPEQHFPFTIQICTSQGSKFQVDPEMIVGGPGQGKPAQA
jgi:hypothetical protein